MILSETNARILSVTVDDTVWGAGATTLLRESDCLGNPGWTVLGLREEYLILSDGTMERHVLFHVPSGARFVGYPSRQEVEEAARPILEQLNRLPGAVTLVTDRDEFWKALLRAGVRLPDDSPPPSAPRLSAR
jgi:hypothetical protein